MRQTFPATAQAFVALSKDLGKELASSSDLLHACHKMVRTILGTDTPGVDQVLMEDCSTSNGLKEDQQHRNKTTPKETEEASEVNTDGRAQLGSSSSEPELLSRTSSPTKQQRKQSNTAREQQPPKSPRRLIRLVAGSQ
jgi:hypothetical protein